MSNLKTEAPAPTDLLGPPPALRAEDAEVHVKLLTRLIEASQPRDFAERVLVSDAAYHVAQIRLLRTLEISLLKAATYQGLERVLRPLVDEDSYELATNWARRDPEALERVDAVLAKAGLTMDAVLAETFAVKIDQVVTIKGLIVNHEKRYAASLKEIEHHREDLAEPVQAVKKAQDAEFEDLRHATVNGDAA